MKNFIFYLLCVISVLSFNSCTDLSGIENDINQLKLRVSTLEDAVESLQIAYDNGKIIKDVTPNMQNNVLIGWKITFSDDTTIDITNGENGADGKNGITPFLKIDEFGYWVISYDDCVTYTRLENKEGDPISAIGVKGDTGDKGDKGDQGDKGDKGDEGLSVRVVITSNGYYAIETYYASHPDKTISTIVTDYSTNKQNIISSITKNEETQVITLVMADGTSFDFDLSLNSPTGIISLANKIYLSKNSETTFEFRVNPSNAVFDINIAEGTSQIELDSIYGRSRNSALSYVTKPKNIELASIEHSVNQNGEVLEGQYKATIRDRGVATHYDEDVVLVLTTKDSRGNKVQLSSSLINICWGDGNELHSFSLDGIAAYRINTNSITMRQPYGSDVSAMIAKFNVSNDATVYVGDVKQVSGVTVNDFTSPVTYRVVSRQGYENKYIVTVSYSELPIVYITTPSAITSKEDWVKSSTIIIGNTAKHDGEYTKSSIKGRGNSTWGYPKKPYAIKLDKNEEVLGMPAHKRWVLLANWMDRTLMRNDIAFAVSKKTTSLEWTPRGQFVDVVLNGVFVGNYYLCEQIKIDANRVPIDKMTSSDVDGDAITGGYLLELDTYYDEVNKFKTTKRQLPVNIKEPDEDVMVPAQLSYIENYFNSLETLLYASDFPNDGAYKNMLDVNSFIDWWFVNELVQNSEPYHPKSSYMFKGRNGKLKAGPAWDYDWGTFKPNCGTFCISTAIWYSQLFKDPSFVALVKEKWAAEKSRFESVIPFIDQQKTMIKKSAEYNGTLWPISTTYNGDESLTFDGAVERLRDSYISRLKWLDEEINKL